MYNDSKHFMKEPMARSQITNSYFEKVFENHFEAWILEEKSFKDETHTLIDTKTRKLRCFDGEINLQASISLQASMEF